MGNIAVDDRPPDDSEPEKEPATQDAPAAAIDPPAADPAPQEMAIDFLKLESSQQRWLAVLTKFTMNAMQRRNRYHCATDAACSNDMNGRVKAALDMAVIAACEKIVRVCQLDVQTVEGPLPGPPEADTPNSPFDPATQVPPAARPRNPQDN